MLGIVKWLQHRWARYMASVTFITGDGEQFTVTFNERDDATLVRRLETIAAVMHRRRTENNIRLLSVENIQRMYVEACRAQGRDPRELHTLLPPGTSAADLAASEAGAKGPVRAVPRRGEG